MANVIDASKIKTNNANTLIQLIPKISKRPETSVKDATYIKTYMVNAKDASKQTWLKPKTPYGYRTISIYAI